MKATKTFYEAVTEETRKAEEEKQKITIALKEAREGLAVCLNDISNALDIDSMEMFTDAKKRKEDLENEIDYYTKLLEKKAKKPKEAFIQLLKAIYAEAIKEYIVACRGCVIAIDQLEKESKKAEDIVKEYNKAILDYKTYVIFDSKTEMPVPDIFPNNQAVGMANRLQYLKHELSNMRQNFDSK